MSDIKYFNQCLWQHYDKQISTSKLTLEKFLSKDEKWGISPLRIKLSINNFKSKVSHYISMTYQDLFQVIMKIQEFKDEVAKFKKEILENEQSSFHYSVKINRKKLVFSFIHRIEYGGPCVRIVISDKDDDYLDSEKVYLSIYDFMSLVVILGQIRNDFVSIVDSSHQFIYMTDISNQLQVLNDKISSYYSEFINKTKTVTISASSSNSPDIATIDVIDPFSEIEEFSVSPEEIDENRSSSSSTDFHEGEMHKDMNNFINDKKDNIKLDIGDLHPPPEREKALSVSGTFTDTFLKNDLSNLEMFITNCINLDLPFRSFYQLIKSEIGLDCLPNVSESELNNVDYLIANYTKHHIKSNLQSQVKFPSNIIPIVFDNLSFNTDVLQVVYDLLLYFIYYSQVRNSVQERNNNPIVNKEFICFSLKSVTSPLVFSHVNQVKCEVLTKELVNRYRRYRECGVFEKVEKELEDKLSFKFSLKEDVIISESTRIYNAIKNNWSKLTATAWRTKSPDMKLKYQDFHGESLTDEQIKKIVSLEFNFQKNGKIISNELSFSGFDDIPDSILKKFNLTEKEYDTSNLKRFFKDQCKDNENLLKVCLEITNKVNKTYRDLRDSNVDLTILPLEILKGLFLWDLDKDDKISYNYVYYTDNIKSCSLEKDMLISLLSNIQDEIDVDFVNSFIASRED